MPRHAPVVLPKRHPVRFPDRCPVCGKASPDHAAGIDEVLGYYFRPLSDDVIQRWQSTVPVCRGHLRRLRNARISDALSVAGFTLAAIAGLLYLAERFELFASGWWSWAGVAVVGLLPYGLMRVVARPLFDVTPDDDLIEFDLRNRAYAADFRALNRP
ncbi:hypothetical protein ENSA5_49750 [Enhygromyxa salina]|uniref:Uncharacterized protein n=1 Tax=Enhygromyxa salina TaxID=215803 RepID=A0A2S9XHI5_9BACT|nr:hypothetical protein [Enhygromyxa salina]PRP92344.1 hypothetical protein ENSA5_49750 [Enhygromyxa salina]